MQLSDTVTLCVPDASGKALPEVDRLPKRICENKNTQFSSQSYESK